MNTRASGDPRRNLDGRQSLDALDGATRGLDSLQQICRGSVRRLQPLTAPRASGRQTLDGDEHERRLARERADQVEVLERLSVVDDDDARLIDGIEQPRPLARQHDRTGTVSPDRKSTRLNSSHTVISYAVFCLKKKNRT